MQGKDAIRQVVEFCHTVTQMYVADLNQSDLLVRSVPGSNHIAWQLGHLIVANRMMLDSMGYPAPELPESWQGAYAQETASEDDPSRFASKGEYLALAEKMKLATLAAIDATPEDSLDCARPRGDA